MIASERITDSFSSPFFPSLFPFGSAGYFSDKHSVVPAAGLQNQLRLGRFTAFPTRRVSTPTACCSILPVCGGPRRGSDHYGRPCDCWTSLGPPIFVQS